MSVELKQEVANLLTHWKSITVRFIIYVVGVYLFGMAIALYLHTSVGVSFLDTTTYAIIAVVFGIQTTGDSNHIGHLDPKVLNDNYAFILLMIYVVLLIIVIIIRSINTILHFRRHHDWIFIIKQVINTLFDVAMMFVWSQFVNLNLLYLAEFSTSIETQNMFVKTWMFILAFLIFCLGISLTVYANMLYGPYNGLSSEFYVLTKWNYKLIRVLFDFLIMIVGIIIFISGPWSWKLKLDYLGAYFGFGTIFFTLIAGPIIGFLVNFWNKMLRVERLDNTKWLQYQPQPLT